MFMIRSVFVALQGGLLKLIDAGAYKAAEGSCVGIVKTTENLCCCKTEVAAVVVCADYTSKLVNAFFPKTGVGTGNTGLCTTKTGLNGVCQGSFCRSGIFTG